MRILSLLIILLGCSPAPEKPETPAEISVPEPLPVSENPQPEHTYDFDLDYLMGKYDPANHPDFTEIPARYADRSGLYLRQDVLEAYLEMYEVAKAAGINLVIRSAARNFDYQKGIWERKWTGASAVGGQDLSQTLPDPVARARKILEYSSMPGTSRHHWGTDIDLNYFENSDFESGVGLRIYEWLDANAGDFGFCQVYSAKGVNRPDGYNMEKWHWSYIPVADVLTDLAARELQDSMISGFAGSEAAVRIGVVEKYVLGINPECRH